MYNTPTVHHVQGGVEMVSTRYGLIKFPVFIGGGVYGSRGTTEDGGLLLVTFSDNDIFRL